MLKERANGVRSPEGIKGKSFKKTNLAQKKMERQTQRIPAQQGTANTRGASIGRA